MSQNLISVHFEVFGRVQGVFFRKYTQKQARELKLRGWCRNTEQGSVEGVLEGTREKLVLMGDWLRNKGSPQSKVERAEFTNEASIEEYSFQDFNVRR